MTWEWEMTCPHCGVYVQIRNLAQYVDERNPAVYYSIGQCLKCKDVTYLRVEQLELADHYPALVRKTDPSVPKTVSADFLEACTCFDGNAYRACATMCRRTIQSIVIDKGALGGTLYEQIEHLADQGLITPPLREWAHEVRVLGKSGAHADVPEDVSRKDAEDALNFTEEMLRHVYMMPAEIARRRVGPTGQSTETE